MGFFDRLANPKMPGESDSAYESRKRREAAAKPAEDARQKALDDAEKKRKKPRSDYPDKVGSFIDFLKGS